MMLPPRPWEPFDGPAAFSRLVFVALPPTLLAMQIWLLATHVRLILIPHAALLDSQISTSQHIPQKVVEL
jgi:hypothetical protein